MISSKWINAECSEAAWPPYKTVYRLNCCLQKHEEPTLSWRWYPIRRILYRTSTSPFKVKFIMDVHAIIIPWFLLGSLDVAREKLLECEVTSNLESDDERSVKKRRTQGAPPHEKRQSQIIDDSSEEERSRSSLPSPPCLPPPTPRTSDSHPSFSGPSSSG